MSLLYAVSCDVVFLLFLVALVVIRRLVAEFIVSRWPSSASIELDAGWTRRPAFIVTVTCLGTNIFYTTSWLLTGPMRGGVPTLSILFARVTLWCTILLLTINAVWFFLTLVRSSDRVVIARAAREFGLVELVVPLALILWSYARFIVLGWTVVTLLVEAATGAWCLHWAATVGGPLSI